MSTSAAKAAQSFNGSRHESFTCCARTAASETTVSIKRHALCVCLFVFLAALLLNEAVILLAVLLGVLLLRKPVPTCF